MGFRQEYWSGLPFPFPGGLPDPGIELASPETPALQVDSLLLGHWGSPSRLFNKFLYTASFQKKDTGFGASQAFWATVFFSISVLFSMEQCLGNFSLVWLLTLLYILSTIGLWIFTSVCFKCRNTPGSRLWNFWKEFLPKRLSGLGKNFPAMPSEKVNVISPFLIQKHMLCIHIWRLAPKIDFCHFLLQGIFPIQGSNLCLSHLPHWSADSLPVTTWEAPSYWKIKTQNK